MKAVVAAKYGAPEVLRIIEIEKPCPKDGEILIQIHATVVGASDSSFRQGKPFIARLFSGLLKPKYVLGDLFAGEVVALGEDVRRFKVGDSVFGASLNNFSTNAEYKCIPEDGILAIKPTNFSFAESVGLCEAVTALIFLQDTAQIQPGQKVLINGASGSVGSYGVQICKHLEADVTGVCSGGNIEMVRALGADHCINYKQKDFTKSVGDYDVIFDAVGKSSYTACKGALSATGCYLSTAPSLSVILNMLLTWKSRGKKAAFVAAGLKQKSQHLQTLAKLAQDGVIQPVIDRSYALADIVEAHRYVDTGRKKGNVVITIT